MVQTVFFKIIKYRDRYPAEEGSLDKDYIQYCRDLLKGKKELTPDLVVKMKIDGI